MGEIISRKEARKRGLKYYFTGEPCKHGHVAKRYIHKDGRSQCYECSRLRSKEWHREKSGSVTYKEMKRRYSREYYYRNKQDIRKKSNEKFLHYNPHTTATVIRAKHKKNGDTYYFTAIPCKYGHISKRRVDNRGCYECRKIKDSKRDKKKMCESTKKYYQKNHELCLVKAKIYRIKNRDERLRKQRAHHEENKERENERSRLWKMKNKESVRKYGRDYSRVQREGLSERYLRGHMTKLGFEYKEIPDWMIELKRKNLKLKRKIGGYHGKTEKP